MKNILLIAGVIFTMTVLSFGQDSGRDFYQTPTSFENPEIVYGAPLEAPLSTLSESFEIVTFPPPGWIKLSPDGGTGWERLTAGTTPFPGWNGGIVTTPPGGGNAVAFATYTTGGASHNDQWLVTPQITNVQAGDELSIWMWFPFSTYADSVDLLISTTGTAPVDFNVIVDQYYLAVGSTDTSWAQYTYSLTNFVTAGSDIYIAWREHVSDNLNDGAIVCLDLVEVSGGGPTLITIAEAREDLNMDFIPDRLGDTVTVAGTVSSPNYNTGNFNYVLHDGTAGITSIHFGYLGTEYNMGDIVQVTGEIGQYNGLTQIDPIDDSASVVYMGTGGTLPDFTVLTISDFQANAEMYEGELIGFISLTALPGGNPWPSPGSNANFWLTDVGGVDTLVMRIDKETDLDDNPEPSWPKDIIGFGGQYSTSTPPNDGYQLLARMYSEILPPGTIPVELTSFTANVNHSGQVELNWSTATETNNQLFEIERRTEGGQFSTIGYVEGHGTTTEPQNYTYTDVAVSTGIYFYRLKQIDFLGTYEYFDEIEVDVNGPSSFDLAQNYPNPFNPSTKINFSLAVDSKVNLKVFDVLGQEVANLISSNLVAGSHNVDFNASGLNSGVYFYRIDATGIDGTNFTSVKKMILTK